MRIKLQIHGIMVAGTSEFMLKCTEETIMWELSFTYCMVPGTVAHREIGYKVFKVRLL